MPPFTFTCEVIHKYHEWSFVWWQFDSISLARYDISWKKTVSPKVGMNFLGDIVAKYMSYGISTIKRVWGYYSNNSIDRVLTVVS